MSRDDELQGAMPVVAEFESFDLMYGEVTVRVTLPEAGELELTFSPSEAVERELLELIGRFVNEHLRELGGREIVIVRSEQPESDDWATDE
jgi:hypothetical protein